MKSLETVQKTFRVFQILTKIAMILSFVWAGLAALGLLGETVMALTDGTLLAFAYNYFKAEQAAGTPFTHEGADQIKRLGIRNIVLPLVAAIIIAVVFAVFGVPQPAGSDWSNISSLSTGIVMILASIIFRYGADLEAKAS